MGRLQHRLIGAVVILGILTAVSVVVADFASHDEVLESASAPESRAEPDEPVRVANQTVPVTPPPERR